jgi:hypothetical protein
MEAAQETKKAGNEGLKEKIKAMTPEQMKAARDSITYIKTVANQANVDITEWDILSIFAAPDGITLLSEKKAINKIFFQHLSKVVKEKDQEEEKENKATEQKTAPLDEEKLFGAFKEAAEKSRTKIIEQKQNQVTNLKAQMDNYFASFMQTEQTFRQQSLELMSLRNIEDDETLFNKVVSDIKKVLAEGLFINPVFKDGMFYLNTKSNAVLATVNRAANLDVRVDLGQFAIRLDTKNSMDLRIIPYKNNLLTAGYYHPHVQSDGRVCWGEAGTMVANHLASLEIGNALRIAYGLINSYNDGNPYRALQEFKLSSRKMTPVEIGASVRHPDIPAPK